MRCKSYFALLPILLTMGFLDLFKKTPATPLAEPKTNILGMVLLNSAEKPDFIKIKATLHDRWQLDAEGAEPDKDADVLTIDGYMVAIAYVPFRIPGDEVARAAAYNYFWENGVEAAPRHKAHILLTILKAGKDPILENILFTKVADAVLRTTPSSGIYLGARTLVLPKAFYLSNAESLLDGDLPLLNWIYFGLRQEKGKYSVYTYGMQDFGKQNMEILDSRHELEDLHAMMYNMTHYVLVSDVTLKHGETIGVSAEQKLKITLSKGKFLNEQTLKIAY